MCKHEKPSRFTMNNKNNNNKNKKIRSSPDHMKFKKELYNKKRNEAKQLKKC